MPYGEPDATDPMQLVGHAMPGEPGGLELMAETVVDEYLRLGFDKDRILDMFRKPFFAMTHSVWQQKGDAWCDALVERVVATYRKH